jgi:hypothetical protein
MKNLKRAQEILCQKSRSSKNYEDTMMNLSEKKVNVIKV